MNPIEDLRNWVTTKAFEYGIEAAEEADRLGIPLIDANTGEDPRDAFRHAYITGKFAYEYDASVAVAFGIAYELFSTNVNSPGERAKDLQNNHLGADIASFLKYSGIGPEELGEHIWQSGRLVLKPVDSSEYVEPLDELKEAIDAAKQSLTDFVDGMVSGFEDFLDGLSQILDSEENSSQDEKESNWWDKALDFFGFGNNESDATDEEGPLPDPPEPLPSEQSSDGQVPLTIGSGVLETEIGLNADLNGDGQGDGPSNNGILDGVGLNTDLNGDGIEDSIEGDELLDDIGLEVNLDLDLGDLSISADGPEDELTSTAEDQADVNASLGNLNETIQNTEGPAKEVAEHLKDQVKQDLVPTPDPSTQQPSEEPNQPGNGSPSAPDTSPPTQQDNDEVNSGSSSGWGSSDADNESEANERGLANARSSDSLEMLDIAIDQYQGQSNPSRRMLAFERYALKQSLFEEYAKHSENTTTLSRFWLTVDKNYAFEALYHAEGIQGRTQSTLNTMATGLRVTDSQISDVLEDAAQVLSPLVYKQLAVQLWHHPQYGNGGSVAESGIGTSWGMVAHQTRTLRTQSFYYSTDPQTSAQDPKTAIESNNPRFHQPRTAIYNPLAERLVKEIAWVDTVVEAAFPKGTVDTELSLAQVEEQVGSSQINYLQTLVESFLPGSNYSSYDRRGPNSRSASSETVPSDWEGSAKEWKVLNQSLKLIERYGLSLRSSEYPLPRSLAPLVVTSRQILVDVIVAKVNKTSVLETAKQVINEKWGNNWQTLLDQMQFTEVHEALQSSTHTTRNANGELIDEAEATQEILEDQGPSILYGNKNDTLTGGDGHDVFVVHRGLGQLHIQSQGDSIHPLDQIAFGGDLTANQISQEQQGDNLVITLLNDRETRKGGHLLSPKNALVCLKTF